MTLRALSLRRQTLLSIVAVAALFAGCDQDDKPGVSAVPDGTLRLTAPLGAEDVTGVLYTIECADGTMVEEYVSLEEEGLPNHVDASLNGQPFADRFTVVPPGE